MRASYKNTSISLLLTFALSLFFVYAMRPNEAVGSGVNPSSVESMGPSSLEVTMKTPEEAGAGIVADDDFKIIINSVSTNSIRTSVVASLTSEKNTLHRVEFYSSPVCGPNGLQDPRRLGAVSVRTNNDGRVGFTTIITPRLAEGLFVAVKAINLKDNSSVVSNCVRNTVPT